MSQTLSPSSARCYGLARVARVWSVSRASVYRSLKETPPNTIARRPGPVGACLDSELADHIRQQIAASRLHGEGYRKLWARLRFAGVRASPRRVRRVMGENGLLAPHRVGRAEKSSSALVPSEAPAKARPSRCPPTAIPPSLVARMTIHGIDPCPLASVLRGQRGYSLAPMVSGRSKARSSSAPAPPGKASRSPYPLTATSRLQEG